jgi:hypothetical protein
MKLKFIKKCCSSFKTLADQVTRNPRYHCNSFFFSIASFPQACIVARAYSHPVDWGGALYQHCVVQGEVNYLTDFMFNMPLTSALVEDVARRLVFT